MVETPNQKPENNNSPKKELADLNKEIRTPKEGDVIEEFKEYGFKIVQAYKPGKRQIVLENNNFLFINNIYLFDSIEVIEYEKGWLKIKNKEKFALVKLNGKGGYNVVEMEGNVWFNYATTLEDIPYAVIPGALSKYVFYDKEFRKNK